MNATKMIAAFATFVATSSVFAQEYIQPDAGFVSSKSRAEVVAELNQAQQNGALQIADYTYPVINFASSKSRAEVKAELARASDTLRVLDHEYPSVQLSGEPRSREQVRAELATAIANGTLQRIVN